MQYLQGAFVLLAHAIAQKIAICKKKPSQSNKPKTLAKLNLVRFFFRAQTTPVPMHAIHTILQDWTEIYRPLLTFALMNASLSASNQPTQVFLVKLSMAYKLNSQLKAQFALRVEDAELLPLEEFRRATVTKSHRLFSDKNGRLLDGFNKHMQARQLLGSWERLTMVVQRLEVEHEGVMIPYYRSWFYESDGSTHARLKNGAWLAYLKEKVAIGKGWNPEPIPINFVGTVIRPSLLCSWRELGSSVLTSKSGVANAPSPGHETQTSIRPFRQSQNSFKGPLTLEPGLTIGKCMTASSNADGALVQLQPCTYYDNQQWTFTGGTVMIFGTRCLDVANGNTTDGTNLQIWTCTNNNTNQQFYYTVRFSLFYARQSINSKAFVRLIIDSLGPTTGSVSILPQEILLAELRQIKSYTCTHNNPNQIWNTGYNFSDLPVTSQAEQYGTNRCGSDTSLSSQCQTVVLNSADDFCLWGPPLPNSTIGNTEGIQVSWCTKTGHGTRMIPNSTLMGVHFLKTPNYVQVTGVGNLTQLNIQKGDDGGELDNRGADGMSLLDFVSLSQIVAPFLPLPSLPGSEKLKLEEEVEFISLPFH
ncbi:hypothetical protein H0H92_005876 [Tricholoma furcatifolium]|nr:hypothetical protein H0H92_005876 [Tricholoma furcatifolium]